MTRGFIIYGKDGQYLGASRDSDPRKALSEWLSTAGTTVEADEISMSLSTDGSIYISYDGSDYILREAI